MPCQAKGGLISVPDEAELTCKIAESEVDFNNGDYCTQKALKKNYKKSVMVK